MATSTRKSSSQTLKQGTLSFGSAKRTSTKNTNLKAKPSHIKRVSALRQSNISDEEDELDVDNIEVPPSDEESLPEEIEDAGQPEKRPRTVLKASKTTRQDETQPTKPPATVLQPKDNTKNAGVSSLPELKENNPRWRKHYAEVKKKMGYQQPSEYITFKRIYAMHYLAVQSILQGKARSTRFCGFSICEHQ